MEDPGKFPGSKNLDIFEVRGKGSNQGDWPLRLSG